MFKAVYTQQTALGVRVGKDIKSVADVKPLQGQQLHNAVAAGVARTLEVRRLPRSKQPFTLSTTTAAALSCSTEEHGPSIAVG